MHKEEWRLKPVGSDLLILANDYQRWVSRRDERVTFLNHELLQRSVRLDIDLSLFEIDGNLDLALASGRMVVPLATVLRKTWWRAT